jgi:hypothetical protein
MDYYYYYYYYRRRRRRQLASQGCSVAGIVGFP